MNTHAESHDINRYLSFWCMTGFRMIQVPWLIDGDILLDNAFLKGYYRKKDSGLHVCYKSGYISVIKTGVENG